jgi:hypothetical protein
MGVGARAEGRLAQGHKRDKRWELLVTRRCGTHLTLARDRAWCPLINRAAAAKRGAPSDSVLGEPYLMGRLYVNFLPA